MLVEGMLQVGTQTPAPHGRFWRIMVQIPIELQLQIAINTQGYAELLGAVKKGTVYPVCIQEYYALFSVTVSGGRGGIPYSAAV